MVRRNRHIGAGLIRNISGRGNKPDFRTISDFRKNNLELLRDLFKQVIQIAMDLGYISLGHVSIDGSKVKAHASKHKAMSRGKMKQEIQRLEQEIQEALEQSQRADEQEDTQPSMFPESVNTEIQDRQARLTKIKEALKQLEERKPEMNQKHREKIRLILPIRSHGLWILRHKASSKVIILR